MYIVCFSYSACLMCAAARAGQVGGTGVVMRSQKEITLREDLDVRDRLDIYRNFLLYCMSGDVVALPMGSTGAVPGWMIRRPLRTCLLVISAALMRHHRAINICQSMQTGSRFRLSASS